MNDNTLSFFSALSERFGITALALWQAFVHYIFVSGVVGVIHATILLTASLTLGLWLWHKSTSWIEAADDIFAIRVWAVVGTIILGTVSTFYLRNSVIALFSPQGQAIHHIFQHLGK